MFVFSSAKVTDSKVRNPDWRINMIKSFLRQTVMKTREPRFFSPNSQNKRKLTVPLDWDMNMIDFLVSGCFRHGLIGLICLISFIDFQYGNFLSTTF